MSDIEVYKERAELHDQAVTAKKEKMFSEQYSDYLMHNCQHCKITEVCPYHLESMNSPDGCSFRKYKYKEKFDALPYFGEANIDHALRILTKMEVEFDLHLIYNRGKLTKRAISLGKNLVDGYLKTHECLKGRTININKEDVLGIKGPEVSELERKIEAYDKMLKERKCEP